MLASPEVRSGSVPGAADFAESSVAGRVSVLRGSFASMEQRISLVTLGVADLSRAKEFYESLGWRGQALEGIVFFQTGCMAFALWGREELAADSGLAGEGDGGFGGICLAHNVRHQHEVDEVVEAAQRAGATVTRPPADTFYGGYAGVFTDLDGHAWEIAHNPGFPIAPDGSITLPDFGTT
nr:VOC family protein [Actinopolyspora xinjiangensis]